MQCLLVNDGSSYKVFWSALAAVTIFSSQLWQQLQCLLVSFGSSYNAFWSTLAAVSMSFGQLWQQLQCLLVYLAAVTIFSGQLWQQLLCLLASFDSSYNVFWSTLAPAVECKQGWAVTDYPFIVSQISKVSNG